MPGLHSEFKVSLSISVRLLKEDDLSFYRNIWQWRMFPIINFVLLFKLSGKKYLKLAAIYVCSWDVI